MNWHTLARSSVLALPLLAGLSACEAVSNILDTGGNTGLDRADDLLGQVERVHVECEVAKQQMQDALTSLHAMVRPDFAGDPLVAFEEYQASIKRSEKQAEELHKAIRPMKRTAEKTFAEWAEDLEEFKSPSMRTHSQARLDTAQERFAAVTATIDPATEAFDAFNAELRDHALYLEHDFNAASIAVIESELKGLVQRGVELDRGFDACLAATRTYVEEGALHGQIASAQE